MRNGGTGRRRPTTASEWAAVFGAVATTLILVLGFYALVTLAMLSHGNHDQLLQIKEELAALLRFLRALCAVSLARC